MHRPRISTNLAISADGKISSPLFPPSGWTSQADKRRLAALRADADAILVGRGTFDQDRMTMTGPKNPLRCIVSRTGRIDPEHPIFSKPGGAIHLLVTGHEIPATPPGVTVHQGSLADFLHLLATDLGVKNLHCEGGGELIRGLAEMDAIDEFHLTLCGHTFFGGQGAPTATGTATGTAGDFLPSTRHLRISHFEPRPDLGECFVSYTRQ